MSGVKDVIKPLLSPIIAAIVTYMWYSTYPETDIVLLAGMFIFIGVFIYLLTKEWKAASSVLDIIKYFFAIVFGAILGYQFYMLYGDILIAAGVFIITTGIAAFMLKRISSGGD